MGAGLTTIQGSNCLCRMYPHLTLYKSTEKYTSVAESAKAISLPPKTSPHDYTAKHLTLFSVETSIRIADVFITIWISDGHIRVEFTDCDIFMAHFIMLTVPTKNGSGMVESCSLTRQW